MSMRLLPLLMAFSLSACTQVELNDAEVTIPKDIKIERVDFKTLSTKVRRALNAANPDALIAVFDENGVTLIGAPDKEFKVEPEEPNKKSTNKSRIDAKTPRNDVVIKTFVHSPMCQYILIGGNRYWYPSGCPK